MSKESQPDESTESLGILEYENPAFIAALRFHVGAKSWSWHRLAKETGLSDGALLKWRRNQSRPTLDNVQALCKVFEVQLSEFFVRGEAIVAEEVAKTRSGAHLDLERLTAMSREEFIAWYESLSEPEQAEVRWAIGKIEVLAGIARDEKTLELEERPG